jgi:hypothetical protein
VRRLENLVQRSDTPLPARVEAERRQREQEGEAANEWPHPPSRRTII